MNTLVVNKNYQTPPSSPFLELPSINSLDEAEELQSQSNPIFSSQSLEGLMCRPFSSNSPDHHHHHHNNNNQQLPSPLSPNTKQIDFFTTTTTTSAKPSHTRESINYNDLKFIAVDDNQINLTIITKFLSKCFPSTCPSTSNLVSTTNPLEVLPLIQQSTQFDVLFLDIEMPELNGVEIAKKIRSIPSLDSLCIIAVTSCSSAQDLALYSNVGIDYTIPKPIILDSIRFQRKVLDAIIKRREQCLYNEI